MGIKHPKDLFLLVDSFLFNKISLIQNSNIYGQYKAFIKNNFEESIQKIINQILTISIIASPLVLVIILFIFNFNMQGKLTTLQSLNNKIDMISAKKGQLNRLKNRIGQSSLLTNEISLKKRIEQIFHKYNLNSSQVKNIKFTTTLTDIIRRVEAQVAISNLSTEGTLNLIKELNDRYKIAINGLTIKKKKGSESLNVTMTLNYLIAH